MVLRIRVRLIIRLCLSRFSELDDCRNTQTCKRSDVVKTLECAFTDLFVISEFGIVIVGKSIDEFFDNRPQGIE